MTEKEYFKLCYTERIHEFSKIATYKNLKEINEAKNRYKNLNAFYMEELNISSDELEKLRFKFKPFNQRYTLYFNVNREFLFKDHSKFMAWYDAQNEKCYYCQTSQAQWHEIAKRRKGNLTLNGLKKRLKGTLEIEEKNPEEGYTFDNSVLACPFCNNAKSNLISESDWVSFFQEPMKKYIQQQLKL